MSARKSKRSSDRPSEPPASSGVHRSAEPVGVESAPALTEADMEELRALEKEAEFQALKKIAGHAARIFEHEGETGLGAVEVMSEALRSARDDFDAIGAMAYRGDGFEPMFVRRCELRIDLALEVANWLHKFERRVDFQCRVSDVEGEEVSS